MILILALGTCPVITPTGASFGSPSDPTIIDYAYRVDVTDGNIFRIVFTTFQVGLGVTVSVSHKKNL